MVPNLFTESVIERCAPDVQEHLDELRGKLSENPDEAVDPDTITNQADDDWKTLWLKMKEDWKKSRLEPLRMLETYYASNSRKATSGIISWFYDAELKLFVIKRFDGVQYFPPRVKYFNSLPLLELKDLVRRDLIDPSRDGYARDLERKL